MIIKRANTNDVDIINRIARETYSQTFTKYNSPKNMQAYLDESLSYEKTKIELIDRTNHYFSIEDKNYFVGYIKMQENFDINDPSFPSIVLKKPTMLLDRFYLYEKWHGTGIADLMMKFCLTYAIQLKKEAIWLGVWENNKRALGFYRKYRFEIIGDHVFMMGDDAQLDYWMMRMCCEQC